jgi:hypothetical protein
MKAATIRMTQHAGDEAAWPRSSFIGSVLRQDGGNYGHSSGTDPENREPA